MSWAVGFMAGLLGLELVANFHAKRWETLGGSKLFWSSQLCFLLGNVCWLWALKHGVGLARGSVIFAVLSTVLTFAMGVLVFRERVTLTQLVGAFFGIFAVVLLVVGECRTSGE